MWMLTTGLVLFIMPHTLRELGLRDKLVQVAPSTGVYKGLYSLVALTGLVLIVMGKSRAPFIMLWQPIFELRFLTHVLMLPAVMLVLAGNLPFSHLRNRLRNPMLLGVCLWGLAHLWSNGDLASALLFGTLTLWAGGKFISRGFAAAAPTRPPAVLWDGVAVVAGLILYVLLNIYHGPLFGVGLVNV